MIGNVLRFRIKKTLVGVAALSLLVPMASHADVTPGKWIFDGFSRSTKDGKGTTCVGSGGDTHAFDTPDCTGAAASAKAAVEAAARDRKAAQDVAAAKKAAAAAEAKEFMPGGQADFRVRRNDGIRVLDGFGRECVKNGSPVAGSTGNCADPTPQSARGVDSVIAARAAARKEAQATSAKAAAAASALPMVPGGALADGQKGAYVYHPAGSSVRDGYGRSCVKDGLWHPALATEDCHPDLYNQWQAKAARPEPELIKRVEMPPPEAERAAEVTAAAPPTESVPAPAPSPAPAENIAKAAIADEAPAEFPITKYAIDGDVAEVAMLPTVAALATDVENDADDEDDEVVAESDETSDDSDDSPAALATPGGVDAVDSAPMAMAAVDDDDVEDDGNAPEEPDDDDDDTMPFLAGDIRDEEDATLAMQDDGNVDGDDDALLDEDDAPDAVFAAAEDDDSGDEAGDDIAASDDVEDDVEAVFLGDADQTADAGEAPTLAMVADDDDDEDPEASDDDDDDTDAVFLGDADQVADAGEATTLAMVADEGDDDEDPDASDDDDDDTEAVFLGDADPVADAGEAPTLAMVAEDDDDDDAVFAADDDDDDTPAAFAADEPPVATLVEAPVAVVAAAEVPKEAPAPAAPVDNKQVEFPVTRYEVEGSAPEAAKAPEPASAPAVAPVANTECPATTIQMEEGRFSFDRSTLRPAVMAKLDAIADLLKSAKCDAIMITGHTDRIGTSKYNQRLSERRAVAAKNYLVARKGIDQSLVSIAGMGKTEPVTKAADCKGKRKKVLIACYAPDRRVVITATTRRN